MRKDTISMRRCIIAGLFSAKRKDIDEVITSIQRELEAKGATVVGVVIQRRGVSRSSKKGGLKQMDAPLNSATVIGSGKVEELCVLVQAQSADTIIFCNELASSQVQRLEAKTSCEILSVKGNGSVIL